ncbi:MAG: HAD family phosphatase [Oscillibacter sp.]|nr:HAD family phosphatase [Oscillibacter sp.]
MRLQSAIFDMDGTLLDSMPVWYDLGPSVLRRYGIPVPPNFWDTVKPLTLRQGAAYCKDAYGIPLTVEEIVADMERQIEDFYAHQVRAKPGVARFLSLLKMEGVWMYVATATDRHLAEAGLKCAGIDGYFRGLMTCTEVGKGKNESAEIYERCMTRLRSNKKDTVIFEDALHAIQTAKAAGFRVAAVYDDSAKEDQAAIQGAADYYIRSFEEMFETRTL